MTQEDKELLLKDLCARLPYKLIVNVDNGKYREDMKLWPELLDSDNLWEAKPYLRPMSSMTEGERKEWNYLCLHFPHDNEATETQRRIDWLNKHHFDYRGLIEKGLALEAPEGMYK